MAAPDDISSHLQAIFGLWPTLTAFAHAIGAKPDTAMRWPPRGRIPERWWPAVIEAAALKGRRLTVDELYWACRRPRRGGWPAHKVRALKRRKRQEMRAS